MAFGYVLKAYNHPLYKYVCAGSITAGLIIFSFAKMDSKSAEMSINATGITLLMTSLFFDALLNTQTDSEKKKRATFEPMQAMMANNFVGVFVCISFILYHYVMYEENLLATITSQNVSLLL